jgi:hypothetical protein
VSRTARVDLLWRGEDLEASARYRRLSSSFKMQVRLNLWPTLAGDCISLRYPLLHATWTLKLQPERVGRWIREAQAEYRKATTRLLGFLLKCKGISLCRLPHSPPIVLITAVDGCKLPKPPPPFLKNHCRPRAERAHPCSLPQISTYLAKPEGISYPVTQQTSPRDTSTALSRTTTASYIHRCVVSV